MVTRSLLAPFLVVLALFVAPSSVAAQTSADATATASASDVQVAEAQALFRRAVELGDDDRWSEALELFRRSLAAVARPSTRFNVGFALFQLGRYREAIEIFDVYLAETEGETSDLRAEAVRRRGEAVASLASLALTLDPPEATLRIDGAPAEGSGATRALSLDPGRHLLLASAPGRVEAQREISLLAAEHAEASISLALVAPIDTGETGETSSGLESDPVFWIVLGSAVLAVGIGVGVGVGVATSQGTTAPYPGSTGVVLTMP